MTEKFTINHNNPYFGCVTLTNPEDKGKSTVTAFPPYTYPSFTYYCSECARLRSLLDAEKNSHAADNVEGGRVRDHLRNLLAKAEANLAEVEKMHRNQAVTITEQAEEIKGLKERNLDPTPHALKAAILVMQKQLDELAVALNKAKKERVDCDADWQHAYKSMQDSYDHYVNECKKKIKELEEKLAAAESEYSCDCCEWDECECDPFDQLREENRNRSYDDKIRRLLNVLASKDEIIAGLQNDLRNDRG